MTNKKLSAVMTAVTALPLAFALNAQEVSAQMVILDDVIPPAFELQKRMLAGKIYQFIAVDGELRGEHLVYISDTALDFIRDHDREKFEDMSAGGIFILTELLKYSGVERTDAMIDGKRIPAKQYFEKGKLTSLAHYLNGKQQDASENDPCDQLFDANTGRIKEAYTCAGGNTKRALSVSELLNLNIGKGLAKPEDRIPGYLRDRIVPNATLPQP